MSLPEEPGAAGKRRAITPDATTRGRRYALRAGLLLAVGLLAFALVDEWQAVSSSFARLNMVTVAEAGLIVTIGVGASALAWRALLRGFGVALPLPAAMRVFFVGQLGKYVPGSVWPVLAQMELSKSYRVGRAQAAAASIVVLGVSVPAGGLLAAAMLPFSSSVRLGRYGWALAAVPVSIALLHPAVLSRILDRLLRLARRPPLPQRLSGFDITLAGAWLAGGFLAFGLATWLLARELGATAGAGRLFMLCTGGYALAWVVGFLVVIVPAGAGIREVVLVLALSPVLAAGSATLLALVLRLLFTVADLVWGGIGAGIHAHAQRAAGSAGLAGSAESAGEGASAPGEHQEAVPVRCSEAS